MRAFKLLTSFSMACVCSHALAGGFQLWEQDASGIGDYHSSAAAEAVNPGTQFYNPAGMTHLTSGALSGGVTYIPLTIHYSGTAGPDEVNTQATSSTNNFIPNLYVVYPFKQHYAVGFGVTTPFGSSTDYPLNNPLADAATKTSLQTLNFNPSVAWAPTQMLSLAVGFDALYAMADYDSAFYFLSHQFVPAQEPWPLANNLTGWAYGWNVGVMLYPMDQLRFGLSYRSALQLDGAGDSTFKSPFATEKNNDLSGVIDLPPMWIMGLYADLNTRWSLLFSAFFTQWDYFSTLSLHNVQILDEAQTVNVDENYRNSWNLALGAHYWIIEKFMMLKMGVGYDQTPTTLGHRDVRLPDAPKYSIALGLHFDALKTLVLDVGWTYFFVQDAQVNNTLAMSDNVKAFTTTVGTSKSNVEVFGLQATWKFQ